MSFSCPFVHEFKLTLTLLLVPTYMASGWQVGVYALSVTVMMAFRPAELEMPGDVI